MLAFCWGDIAKSEVIFVCPRGCCVARIEDAFNKMTPKQAKGVRASLLPTSSYRSVCWNCKEDVDASYCKREAIPTLGFICKHCGYSLRQLLEKLGIITSHSIRIPQPPREIWFTFPD